MIFAETKSCRFHFFLSSPFGSSVLEPNLERGKNSSKIIQVADIQFDLEDIDQGRFKVKYRNIKAFPKRAPCSMDHALL